VGGLHDCVGIGTDDPQALLDTPGPVRIGPGTSVPGLRTGLMIIADDNTELSFPLDVTNQNGDFLLFIRGSGKTGLGTGSPLTRFHVEESSILVPSGALQSDVMIVEDEDAVLGLYSSAGGSAGSAITFGEVTGGALVDKWAIVRETPGGGKGLRFTFGTNSNQFLNTAVMYLDDSGSVGIGTATPGSWKLYVNGTACGTSAWGTCSDRRFKADIEGIESALDKVLSLRGVRFSWRIAEYGDKGFPEGKHYGVIAQEVDEVLPEVVEDGPGGEKTVAYSELIPVLIESIKELKAENEILKQRIEALEIAGSQ
jgi:hypothetical protein